MKVVKKKIPLYFGILQIVVANDFVKALNKLKIPYSDSFTPNSYGSFIVPSTKETVYVFVRKNVTSKIIAHEAVHIVNDIFNRVHIKLDLDNDEPQAYLMGWVVEQIHKAVKK